MPPDAINPLDPDTFFQLRTAVEELDLGLHHPHRRRWLFPTVPDSPPAPTECVSADDVLTGTLGAVASASRRLSQAGAVLGLGSHPLTMQFAGELVGASPDGSQILLRVAAGKTS